MSLSGALSRRAAEGRPVRVGLIGAGTFGRMFLAQARRTPGFHVTGIADLRPDVVRDALPGLGWPAEQGAAGTLAAALRDGTTWVGDDPDALFDPGAVDVVVEATGDPAVGLRHAAAAIDAGQHVVMVNVEADVLAGPLLARRAADAGVVYSLASGDQPALVCDLVDWARTAGFEVVAAGKGTRFLPEYLTSTPDTVWPYYGMDPDHARAAGFNAQMFNSFLDGTKSAIEMAAVANATGLAAPADGLRFPPCGTDALATVLRPREDGGVLDGPGTVEVVSSLERDGSDVPRDLRWGVYVVFAAADEYVEQRFADYGVETDPSGRYAALYRPSHLIGLELGISVASAALRGEATGAPEAFRADVVAVAKRDLAAGDVLDGEGGAAVRGHLLPASASLARGGLPIGLAHRVALTRPVAAGAVVGWDDVALDASTGAAAMRREMERASMPVAA
jgi:predicted homoserine dehydrogenase-like protein